MVWTGAGALLLAAFASALAVIPDAAPIVSQELTKQRVLASGYSTFTGPKGHTPTAGAPWGSACVPVLFSLPPGASPELQAALTQVVDEARNGGLNVVALRGGTYDPSSLLRPAPGGGGPTIVPLKLDSGTPPISPSGRPTKVNMGWSMALAPDGRTEYLTKIRPVLFLKALGGDPVLERKVLRSVLAWSQGISGSSLRGTGIARHSIDSADTFTAQDLEAMRVMSGC